MTSNVALYNYTIALPAVTHTPRVHTRTIRPIFSQMVCMSQSRSAHVHNAVRQLAAGEPAVVARMLASVGGLAPAAQIFVEEHAAPADALTGAL